MLTLDVAGMTCGHCEMAVKKALESVPGVTGVRVSLAEAKAWVEGKAAPEALLGAVEEEGYRARLPGGREA